MKCLLLGVVCWLSVSAGAGHNLLILIADDLGLDGLSFSNADAGASFPSVPHLESMADEGVVFTRAYTYPTCSPTRAAMLTGRHGFRTGVLSPSSSGAFSAEEHTFPEAFAYQALGYATASFVSGIWGEMRWRRMRWVAGIIFRVRCRVGCRISITGRRW